MSIQAIDVEYAHDGATFSAHVAWDASVTGPRPGVLVAHAWGGRSEFEDRRAEQLAELGYVGFALDLYGKGVRGGNADENAALMQPLLDDRLQLQKRMAAALDQLGGRKDVDRSRMAAIGFCFGGLCVLDLARSGADVSGVASFHGLLGSPEQGGTADIAAKVLVLHGWQDPLATPEQVLAFSEEMSSRHADWQLHAYGKAMHAFTNPAANDVDHGLLYDPEVDHRSWDAMRLFLGEVFV